MTKLEYLRTVLQNRLTNNSNTNLTDLNSLADQICLVLGINPNDKIPAERREGN